MSYHPIDILGLTLGVFKVVEFCGRNQKGEREWLAECVNGHQERRTTAALTGLYGCPTCKREKANLVGKTYGTMTVTRQWREKRIRKSGGQYHIICETKCICGRIRNISGAALKAGRTVSCGYSGCSNRGGHRLIDLTGKKVKHWTVVGRGPIKRMSTGLTQVVWLCKCDCGRERIIGGHVLVNWTPKCNCQKKTHHPLYKFAKGIQERVKNPESKGYENYGGRTDVHPWICPEWDTGQTLDLAVGLLEEIGPRPTPGHSIDRIDVGRGYVPGNLRWATAREQAQNRRPMVILSRNGERLYRTCRSNIELARWILKQPEGLQVLREALEVEVKRRRVRAVEDSDPSSQGVLPLPAAA